VFEGAQGLMLDEFMGFFPHVTRSMTGLPNAIEVAAEFGIRELLPVYVTRSYLTRHGAGPLSHEGERFAEDDAVVDHTNVTNEWQGSIRYAPLNMALMRSFISQDLRRGQNMAPQYHVNIGVPQIALHCLDQIGQFARVYNLGGKAELIQTGNLARYVTNELGIPVSITGHGPSQVYFH
jgi:adenylosuccinate synthase